MKSTAVPDLLDLDDIMAYSSSADRPAPFRAVSAVAASCVVAGASASPVSPVPGGMVAFAYTNVDAAASNSLYAAMAQDYFHPGSANPLSGAGVKVGILSNSFDMRGGQAADVADGDLPSGIDILQDGRAGDDDEGRAMAEGIHRIAPGAQLYFFSADQGEANFAYGIMALFDQGCRVIVDDVTYLDEPFFQPGSALDQAIDYVVAHGATYLTSAGNSGDEFYEADFKAVTATLGGVKVQAEDFGGGNVRQSLTVQPGAQIQLMLEWDQPYASIGEGGGATSSLALELFLNGVLVATSINTQGVAGSSVGRDPVQLLSYTAAAGAPSSLQLAIVENGGNTPPVLFKYVAFTSSYTDLAINDPNAGIGSGTVVGHHEDPNAITVGAANSRETPEMGVSPAVLEGYSSAGPGEFLFDAAGQRLATPQTLSAVSIVSTEGETTSVNGLSPFEGTSSAAANAAGVVALLEEADPGATPSQIRADLTSTAVPVDDGPTLGGAGLIRADLAVLAAGAVVACFARGTRLATPRGQIAVERLRVGELVCTASGARRPIKWIGLRSYDGPFAARSPDLWPVLIRAGALADGVPHADLRVSRQHAMFLGGVLVPAALLVNGVTIVSEAVPAIDYLHVELDSHDVLVAEGAPTESFADLDGRAMFHNAASYRAMYPGELGRPRLCAPRVQRGPLLRQLRETIAARIELLHAA